MKRRMPIGSLSLNSRSRPFIQVSRQRLSPLLSLSLYFISQIIFFSFFISLSLSFKNLFRVSHRSLQAVSLIRVLPCVIQHRFSFELRTR
uniref:Uncharacterized protein n=1 Tax=Brassica juncea TaxID=3707 RepID=Q2M5C8_BRAJU|nr:unknown protein 5 [Brassica juncea]